MDVQKSRDVTDHQIARIDKWLELFGILNVDLAVGAAIKALPEGHLLGRFKMVAPNVNNILHLGSDTLGFLRRRLTMVSVMSPDPRTKMFLIFDFDMTCILLYTKNRIGAHKLQIIFQKALSMLELQQNNISSSQLSRAAPQLVLHPLYLASPSKFCQKIKPIMSLIISQEQNHQGMILELIEECTKRKDKTGDVLSQFLKVYLVGSGCGSSWKTTNEEKGFEVMAYFAKMMENGYQMEKQVSVGCLWETVLQGQKIIKGFRKILEAKAPIGEFKIISIVLYNGAVGYSQLNMYQQALRNIKILQDYSHELGDDFRARVDELKGIVLVKMGKKSDLLKHLSSKRKLNVKNTQKDFEHNSNNQVFFELISKEKRELLQYINQLSKNAIPVSVGNAYNICLLCKKYQLYDQGVQILLKILLKDELPQLFKWKSFILLSQFYDFLQKYPEAIECLNRIDSENSETIKQIKFRVWELNKKIKIKKATITCPLMSPIAIHRYKLLQNLQLQLQNLTHTRHTQTPIHTSRKIISTASTIYSTRSKKQVSKQSIPPQRTLRKIPQHKASQLCTSRLPTTPSIKIFKAKKTVMFQLSSAQKIEDQLADLIYQCQETIQSEMLQENSKGALAEIHKTLEKLWAQERIIETRLGYKFMLKCVNWLRKLNDSNSAISLLTKMVSMTQDKQQKIELLNHLNSIYQLLNDDKKVIAVNQELFKLGQVDSLDKIAEQYLARQKYSDAIKYYEQYFNLKPTLYSEVKLAHAYSKVCTFMKKAIDILNHILFENKTNCIFRKFLPEETENFQNAAMLLASIYMQSNGFKKAQEICEKFVESNYSAYPVYHLLGVICLQNEDTTTAFQYFINALKLKPNHLPSLIQAVRYVQNSKTNKCQIIQIVRKAFAYNHRNWEILLLLTEVLGGQVRNQRGVSLRGLIDCALAVEEAGGVEEDLLFEAETIWLWALEVLQHQEGRLPIGQKDELTILIRLGQINMLKGSYLRSESYFSRIVSKFNQKTNELSKPRCQEIKLHLKILDKLTFLKLQQEKLPQAFDLLDEAYQLAKRHFLLEMLTQIKKKREALAQCHGF